MQILLAISRRSRHEASKYSNVLPFFERLSNAFLINDYVPDLVINFDGDQRGRERVKESGGGAMRSHNRGTSTTPK
jgi:hypothetical protein